MPRAPSPSGSVMPPRHSAPFTGASPGASVPLVAGEIVGVVAGPGPARSALLLDVAVRAMVQGDPLLLLDVPFELMDHEARVVASALARAAVGEGAAVVVVAHRHASIAHLAHRILVLREGRLVPSGTGPAAPPGGGTLLH